jgi:hypothetical protein
MQPIRALRFSALSSGINAMATGEGRLIAVIARFLRLRVVGMIQHG